VRDTIEAEQDAWETGLSDAHAREPHRHRTDGLSITGAMIDFADRQNETAGLDQHPETKALAWLAG
jgi:hypothetical protein